MRYTTIIDLTEYPALYNNINVRLVYMHMVLKSGYHDNDRDLCSLSVRRLANEVGITISAVRHALRMLSAYGMVHDLGTMRSVTKWCVSGPITARSKTAAQAVQQENAIMQEASRIQRDKEQRKAQQERQKLAEQGKTSFMVYVESLKAKADAGDEIARRDYERHKAMYEQHRLALEAQKGGKQQ